MPLSDTSPDYETLTFETAEEWRAWLEANHAGTAGIWIKIYKKATDKPTVRDFEALDHALCFGWIDGQRKGLDEESFLQKFTPRRPHSLWSKRNIEHIARLTAAGLMTPAGQREVELAQADGRWAAAYDGPASMTVPDDFVAALADSPVARATFDGLTRSQRYYIGWQLATAKRPETRQRRLEVMVVSLAAGVVPG